MIRIKRLIKNQRPITSYDMKLISETFIVGLQHVLPTLISSKQTAYVKSIFTREIEKFIQGIY